MAEPKNKTEAKKEIERLRSIITRLKNLVPERQSDGRVIYFPGGAGSPGVSKQNIDGQISRYTKQIENLNAKFFAETVPPQQAPTGPVRTAPGGSPGAGAPVTADQIRKTISALEKLKPDAQGLYKWNGEQITPARRDQLISNEKNRLSDATSIEKRTGETRQDVMYQKFAPLIARFGDQLQAVQSLRVGLEGAMKNMTDTKEYQNVLTWVNYYKTLEKQLQKNLDSATAENESGITEVNVVFVTESEAKANPQTSGATRTPGATPPATTATTTQGMFGQPVTTPGAGVAAPPAQPPRAGALTGAARGEMGIDQGTGRPAVVPTGQPETPPITQTPTTPTTTTTPTGQTPAGTPTVPGGGSAGGTVGGTPSGTVPPAAGTTPAAPGALNIPADWEKAAREAYGSYYDAIKNIPELRDFINELMTGPQLSNAQFMAKLQQTNWWRTTTASARDFARRQVEDPATLQTQISNARTDMRQKALALGLSIDDTLLTKVVTDQIKFGWSEQVTLDYLGEQSRGTTEGAARLRQGFYGQQVRERAARYGIPLSDVTFTNWVNEIASGQQNLSSFDTYVREQAKILYPALSNGLDRGLSFTDLTSPYAAQASRILEIPAEQIDFTDPRWARAFTSRNDKGEQIQMSYGEWADYLRSDPSFGWEYTDQAKSQAYDLALEIGKMFGRAG
jgi:hypothetical protein